MWVPPRSVYATAAFFLALYLLSESRARAATRSCSSWQCERRCRWEHRIAGRLVSPLASATLHGLQALAWQREARLSPST